jgi:AraC-like DNA-binding protein
MGHALVRRRPPAALAPFVEAIWHFSGSFAHARERVLPTGSFQLLVNLHEDELRSYHGDGLGELRATAGAALGGAFDAHFAIDTAEQRNIAGVAFRPGGTWPFFREPASETGGQHLALELLWGGAGARVRERLCDAHVRGGPEAVITALGAILLERAVRPLDRVPLVRFAVDALADRPVSAVTASIGLSPRRFIARFHHLVGLTPKRWVRVRRFQQVVRAVADGRPVRWAALAAACGYFDQSHLIHDFRAFSGVCPTAYRPRTPGDGNHIVLAE